MMTLASARAGGARAEQGAARSAAAEFQTLIGGVVGDLKRPGSWVNVTPPRGVDAEALRLALEPVVVHDLKVPFSTFAQALKLAADELEAVRGGASAASEFVDDVLQAVVELRAGFAPVAGLLEGLRVLRDRHPARASVPMGAIEDGPFRAFVDRARDAVGRLAAHSTHLQEPWARAAVGSFGASDGMSPLGTALDVLALLTEGAEQLRGNVQSAVDLEARLGRQAQPQPGELPALLDQLAAANNVLVAVPQPSFRGCGAVLALSSWGAWKAGVADGGGPAEAEPNRRLQAAMASQPIERPTLDAALRALLRNAEEAARGSGTSSPALVRPEGASNAAWRASAATDAGRRQGRVALVVAPGAQGARTHRDQRRRGLHRRGLAAARPRRASLALEEAEFEWLGRGGGRWVGVPQRRQAADPTISRRAAMEPNSLMEPQSESRWVALVTHALALLH
ncbi:MAG: hypothetical protein IPG96_20495 [Proteobacteria bacterium]|nr:hypothetical protein [Pseudomonadota bacterium]